jgi:hypothetical protein
MQGRLLLQQLRLHHILLLLLLLLFIANVLRFIAGAYVPVAPPGTHWHCLTFLQWQCVWR